ncbi:MAG: ribonuclease E/G [Alphaproteobacteria bacterium]|nr:ribonuclease E/G [Alphaproteobacteria bacterium]
MTKKMLIDANHIEEKRVVIVDGTKLEELDIESSNKKQIKSNIYLAKVARVEPSLQAAFVDYGGNRHGFLAFNEIHPDYYQIPVADREALIESMQDDEEDAFDNAETEQNDEENNEDNVDSELPDQDRTVETVSENESDEVRQNRFRAKRYKIQEVIHKGQVLLVQVIKEERGNKGAALTTYLSLAGRYCVLMPNNTRGGGVSRKITNAADRKRLKKVVAKLPLPEGMSVIVRTAGKERTSLEIKRDYEYLIKTWIQIRDKTMESSAPLLIHEEGDIIKRALRDMYTRDIEEILVEGDENYKQARDFMKLLTPSHVKKVKLYKDEKTPLFFKYQVEGQLESLHSNIVQLKSGAYLVMDQTEALVAIDVNSGRATKEKNIEETALKTNLEAAEEIARQLRLRDMAGLVVVDFIDMDEARNNHALERKMKEVLRKDRARVQMGRITGFGLMELSRQRMHSSFIETSYSVCPYCHGKGMMRSTESVAIHTLHVLEEESMKLKFSELHLTVPTEAALYVLNNKRKNIETIENLYNVKIFIEGDSHLMFPTDFRIEHVIRQDDIIQITQEEPKPVEEEKVKSKKQKSSKKKQIVEEFEEEVIEDQEQEETEIVESQQEYGEEEQQTEEYSGEDEVISADAEFEAGLQHDEQSENKDENNHHKNFRRGHRDRRFGRRRHFHHHHENEEYAEENENNEQQSFDEGEYQENSDYQESNENNEGEHQEGEGENNEQHRHHRKFRKFGRRRFFRKHNHHNEGDGSEQNEQQSDYHEGE